MKNRWLKILLIVLLSIIAIGIIFFMVKTINRNSNFLNFNFFVKVSDEIIVDESYNIDFNKIEIENATGDVYIKESADNLVKLVIYGNKENTNVNAENGNLAIKVKQKKCTFVCFNHETSKIELYLPNNYENLISIENKLGNIEIGNFENATIEVKEDCGDVSIISANTIKINNKLGNIKINETKKVDIIASAGNVEIDSVSDAIIKNKLGNIELDNIYNYIDLDSKCGDIELGNVLLNKNSSIKSDLGDIEIDRINEIYIDAKTDLGNVKINNNYNQSNVILKIENDCGDISIDN